MTIYDADYAFELQAQEDAEKAQNTAVLEPIAEVQEDPKAIQDDSQDIQEEAVEQESRPVEESDSDRNWRAVREELQRIKEENAYLRGKTERQPEKEAVSDEFSSLDDDEYLSKSQVKKYLEQFEVKNQQKLAEIKLESDQELMRMQFDDYDEVINNHFIPLIEQNPYFKVQLRSVPNAASYAYKIGKGAMLEKKMMQQKETPLEQKKSSNAERIVSNSRKPATLSSARGGAPKMSQSDYYATLSDAEFSALVKKNLDEV